MLPSATVATAAQFERLRLRGAQSASCLVACLPCLTMRLSRQALGNRTNAASQTHLQKQYAISVCHSDLSMAGQQKQMHTVIEFTDLAAALWER